jgi:hypothetical protein
MLPEEPARPAVLALLDNVRDFLRSLLDLRFEQLITPRMLPTLYLLAIAASAYGVLTYAIEGFTRSFAVGVFRLVLVAPVGFVVLVTLCRIGLEFLMVVFRLAVNVSEMAGHTGDIASGLPRIQFWKGLLSGGGKSRARE